MSTTYSEACSLGSLLSAYGRARKAGRYRDSALSFSYHLESNLLALHRELMDGTYVHGPYREFIVNDSKKRRIKAATFRDRVVHQALHAAIEPLFEAVFIRDSYACRKGKGTHQALRRITTWIMREGDRYPYALACDISKYFASINQEVLMGLLARQVSDTRLLGLCRIVVESASDDLGVGMPIGNLTSQLFANVYLHELDCFVKRRLGMRRYIRYMDDFIIFGTDSASLQKTKKEIAVFLTGTLTLALHPTKAVIFPIPSGLTFLGYRLFRHHRKLRKSTVRRFARRTRCLAGQVAAERIELETLANGIRSWRAYADAAASRGLIRSLSSRLGVPFRPIARRAVTTNH